MELVDVEIIVAFVLVIRVQRMGIDLRNNYFEKKTKSLRI